MSVRCCAFVLLATALLVTACTPATQAPTQSNTPSPTHEKATATTEVTETPSPQPTLVPGPLGPNLEDFPEGYNPLTGQPAADPSLLDIPALLLSISHFPATARPQAGLSFAPYVFEYSITNGETRNLAAIYGEFPEPEIPLKGDCAVRWGAFEQTNVLIGNQVWLDANADGFQGFGERGIGGICVNLYDAAGDRIQQTTTDSNGYYGFNVKPGQYTVEVLKPDWLDFTEPNVGDDKTDSDTDQLSGRMEAEVTSSPFDTLRTALLSLDSGLVPSSEATPTPDPTVVMPKAEVGPIRSGRLLYAHIGAFFQESCLLYAFASDEVLAQIPKCAFVAHNYSGGGSMISLERLHAIAEEHTRKSRSSFNYASNLYESEPPSGGVPASAVDVYFGLLNQMGWRYDPLYGAWLRYVDTSKKEEAGVLHPEVDRLTGRQLHFENFILLFAEHEVISPTNLNIQLDQGNSGPAFLFRDGKRYEIEWSTISGEYEQKTGFRRPIQFLNINGTPAALKPGHTWVLIVTPYSLVTETSPGVWNVRYLSPDGAE